MTFKNTTIVELMMLSVVFGTVFALIETQEQVPTNENQQSLNNLGSISGSTSSKLSDSAVQGKNSRYIIRFARTPSSMIRFSRSPSSQIRFGRSQPFVRFGRSGDLNDDYGGRTNSHYTSEKFIRFARNGMDDYYTPDENIQLEPRSGGDSGFIRFGRSHNLADSQAKAEQLRAINWRNFLRLGRNTNGNIRFAGKRDGSSTGTHHNTIPLEIMLEKISHDQKPVHSPNADSQDNRNMAIEDEQMSDGIESNPEQFQGTYSNDLE